MTLLRQKRLALGLTLAVVAEQAEMDIGKLSRLERGLAKLTIEDAYRLADAMGCNLSDLAPDKIPTEEPTRV